MAKDLKEENKKLKEKLKEKDAIIEARDVIIKVLNNARHISLGFYRERFR